MLCYYWTGGSSELHFRLTLVLGGCAEYLMSGGSRKELVLLGSAQVQAERSTSKAAPAARATTYSDADKPFLVALSSQQPRSILRTVAGAEEVRSSICFWVCWFCWCIVRSSEGDSPLCVGRMHRVRCGIIAKLR